MGNSARIATVGSGSGQLPIIRLVGTRLKQRRQYAPLQTVYLQAPERDFEKPRQSVAQISLKAARLNRCCIALARE